MSFLDALIPGSQKYDLYAKSISLPATTKQASVVQAGAVDVAPNPAINIPITITSLSGINVLQIADIEIPSTAITVAPAANALIRITVTDNSLSQEAFTMAMMYKLSSAANYVAGTVTKTVGNNNIIFTPAATGFPQPLAADTLQIVSSSAFVVTP